MATPAPNDGVFYYGGNNAGSSRAPQEKQPPGRVMAPDHRYVLGSGLMPQPDSVVGWRPGSVPVIPPCHGQATLRKAK